MSVSALWFNAGRLDSSAIDTFNVSTSTWDQIAQGWYKYVGALLDSVRIHAQPQWRCARHLSAKTIL
jgi:Uri superfamily endonuclease